MVLILEERVCALLYQKFAEINITRDGSELAIFEYVARAEIKTIDDRGKRQE